MGLSGLCGILRAVLCVGSMTALVYSPLAMRARAQSATQTANPAASAEPESILSGVGVILKVDFAGPEPVFEADGYRIRIAAGASTTFSGTLKSLADVGPDVWIRYKGQRDDTGVVVASAADFFPAGTRKGVSTMGPRKASHAEDYKPIKQDALLDADGHLRGAHTKVRYSDAGGPCGWHRVPADEALQERVERIGMRLVPAYQVALKADDPSRISFRFYAVAEDKLRSVLGCNMGLVLVPKNVVERMQNDDQLAAVLADGVAANLQRQFFTITPREAEALGIETAGVFLPGVAGAAGMAGQFGAEFVGNALMRPELLRFEQQQARIALQLMADAGYDPWQAPEAWRLLAPRDLPKDTGTLPYTREGAYQLKILKLQYPMR